MKTKAALEAVGFAKQLQKKGAGVTDEEIDKLCKMAGVKLYRNVDVTRPGRIAPTRNRRAKNPDRKYFTPPELGKMIGVSGSTIHRMFKNDPGVRKQTFAGPGRRKINSIAVLPFTSMSADAQDEFFADGMTEEIINALAQIEQLHVVARTSAFSFKGKYIDVRDVGKRLNVRTVLLGSIRRAGNEIRVTAQLINVEDGYHLWSDRFDRAVKDIFEVQDEIARSIADKLKVTLKAGEQAHLVTAGTSLESYQLYVKGRALLYRRGGVISRAAECFEREVGVDPDYALAWAGLLIPTQCLGTMASLVQKPMH